MTNYNERLDEIVAPLIDSPTLTLTTTYWDEAKQAITSLIKELVAEARIDELEIALDENAPFGEGQQDIAVGYVEFRLAELRKEDV